MRDKDTGEILSTTRLRRLIDYTLDFFRDTIIFDYPIRQADDDGNPISVRVTWQTEGNSDETYWLYGGEGYVHASESLPLDTAVFEDGFYLKLRLKLDDGLWGMLDRFLSGWA